MIGFCSPWNEYDKQELIEIIKNKSKISVEYCNEDNVFFVLISGNKTVKITESSAVSVNDDCIIVNNNQGEGTKFKC